MKLTKWIFSLLLVVLLIPAAAALWLLLAFDPNDYREEIETLAKNQHVALSIEGDMGWQFFPNLGISIQQVSFDDARRGARGNIAGIALVLDWRQLLQRQIAVQELTLTEADLTLDDPALLAATAAPAAGKTQVQSGDSSFSLAVESLRIIDSRLTLNSATQSPQVVEKLNLSVARLSLAGDHFPVELALRTTQGEVPIDLNLQTALQLDMAQGKLAAKSSVLALSTTIGQQTRQLNAEFDLHGDLNQGQIALSPLQLRSEQFQLDGSINYQLDSGKLQGELKSNNLNLRSELHSWGVALPDMQGAKALQEFSASTKFTWHNTATSTLGAQLTIDGQPLSLQVEHNAAGKKLQIALSGQQLNLSNYLPPQTAASAESDGALLAPLLAPAALWPGQSELKIDLAALQLPRLHLNNLGLTVHGSPGKVQIPRFNAQLFGGSASINASLRDGAQPSIHLQPSLTNIELVEALPVLAEFQDMSGKLDLSADIRGSGTTMDQLIESLSGGGNFHFREPVYRAMNIEQSFCEAATMLSPTPQTARQWPAGTVLDNLDGSFHFQQGHLLIDNYQSGTGNLKISGKGRVRIAEQRYNFNADARVNGDPYSH